MKQKTGRKLLSFLLTLAMVISLMPGMSLTAYAAASISGTSIDVFDSASGTVSSDMTCTRLNVFDSSTLTINQGVTVTLNNPGRYFAFFDNSKIELHGTLAGSAGSNATWMDRSYINVYLSDGAKYTVTGLSCMDDYNGKNEYLVYYGYDAATDGNGTVSVKNGSTDVTSTSKGYKATTYIFTATPSDGYKFVNWTKGPGGEVLGTDASISVTCEQNGQYQVYANFESDKTAQTITAADVTVTYGDTGKSISGTTSGDGAISYSVKSGDAVNVESTSGALTIVKAGSAVITVTAAETTTYAQATKDVNVTVNTKAMTVTAADVNVAVDGQPHGITVNVTDPASGATVKYGTEAGTYNLDASPTQTEAGELTVYYQVTADNYTTYTGSAKVTVNAKQTQTITAENVTANYGDTDKKISATTNGNGAISYAVKDGCEDYIDVNTSTGALTIKKVGTATVIVTAAETATYEQATKEVTVTINKAAPTVTAPTAKTLTYNGSAQQLVNAGSATGGTMWYAVTTENTAPADNLYTTDIPTKTEAGTYYVWYKVVGDGNYNDTTAICVTATIKSAASGRSATPADALVYNGAEQALVKAGSVEGGTLMYAVTTEPIQPAAEAYSEAIPTASQAGTYYVWYYVKGDKNHNDTEPAMLTVVIAPQPAAEPATPDEPSYLILAKLSTSGKKALKVSWTKVPGAEGFDIYLAHCGQPLAQVGSVGGSAASYTVKGLKKYDAYKGFVRAWKTVNGAKVTIGESPLVHAVTGGKTNKYTNPKKVTVKKSKVKLTVGKTSKIKASVKKATKSRKLMNHESKLRYYSNNPAVATVSASGKITAVGAGSCKIYVVAINGARAAVKVTVK